jgi:MtN3 and saliva related transmembrane protein
VALSKTEKFDRFMIAAGLISPIATIPQIIKLLFTHDEHASGQSLTTWMVYTVLAVLWAIYGVVNNQLAVLVGNSAGAILYGVMAIGIILQVGLTF